MLHSVLAGLRWSKLVHKLRVGGGEKDGEGEGGGLEREQGAEPCVTVYLTDTHFV